MANLLSQKAVLAGVNIRRWTGRRLDREITDEVNEQHNAEADAGRYNKLLIAKSAFADIHRLTSAARHTHYVLTQPWFDEGARILPTAMYDKFAERFRKFRDEFNAAADEFAKNYPRYVKEAEKRLGDMFDKEDYPEARKVRGMFDFDVRILPCPDADDFRIKLGKEQADDIRSELEQRMKEALDDAMKEPVRRIIKVVEKMAERLKAYKPSAGKGDRAEGLFRDSLVDNVRELVELLPAFNLTEDKVIASLTKRMEKELCRADAQDLRDDEDTRKAVAKAAESILEQAQALMA